MKANTIKKCSPRQLQLFLIPAVWLIGLLAICLANIFYIWAVAIALLWGIACYVLECYIGKDSKPQSLTLKIIRHCVVFPLICIFSMFIPLIYDWITWDPIGSTWDLGWGGPPCVTMELPGIRSRNGIFAMIRRAECPIGFFSNTEVTYFVFLDKVQGEENDRNLVFRYDATEAGSNSPPIIEWPNNSSLNISVGRGRILQITKQRASTDGINIAYYLESATFPPSLWFWQRLSFF